jgi:hypothetical protein
MTDTFALLDSRHSFQADGLLIGMIPLSVLTFCTFWYRQFMPALQCYVQEQRIFGKTFPLCFLCSLLFKILGAASTLSQH